MQLLTHTKAFQGTDSSSVEPLHRAHGGLNVQGPDILPVLLQQGDQEVHGQVNILDQIILSHSHVTNSDRQAEHLKRTDLFILFIQPFILFI